MSDRCGKAWAWVPKRAYQPKAALWCGIRVHAAAYDLLLAAFPINFPYQKEMVILGGVGQLSVVVMSNGDLTAYNLAMRTW